MRVKKFDTLFAKREKARNIRSKWVDGTATTVTKRRPVP